MPEQGDKSKLTTEGSAAVLNEVKGRLEKMEAGELPTIERVGPDGTSRRVDHTGEMVRPDVTSVDEAARAAAEAFASEHRLGTTGSTSPPPASAASLPPPPGDSGPAAPQRGLWARIMAWFRRE